MRFVYDDVKVRRRKLPHWDTPQGLYFVTFRLKDAIPLARYREMENRKQTALIAAQGIDDEDARMGAITLAQRVYRSEIEECLDEGHGSCVLAEPAAAEAAHQKLISLDESVLALLAHAVMPNHIHTVFRMRDFDLSETMKRIKGGCSFDVNRALGRSGTLWQGEFYDTLVRDERHLQNAVQYVLDNPAKAGLREWPWTYVSDRRLREVLGLERGPAD